MQELAEVFVASLNPAQRVAALFDFADAERFRWQYTPGVRDGLPLKDMRESQQECALALMDAGLSESGAETARQIIRHEAILKKLEEEAGRPGSSRRDPERYYFSVFGDPASEHSWAWRVGGHHLCLHFTIVGGTVASTPLFFGVNPARVPHGRQRGRRLLAPEEDLARELLACLDIGQRRRAVVASTAPDDILTRNAARADISQVPRGIGYGDLATHQRACFAALVGRYVARVRHSVDVNLDELSFSWAGSTEPSRGHYYAVRGSTFLIEYDNTQNNANHIHTVWRDTAGDWGDDLLASHYLSEHR